MTQIVLEKVIESEEYQLLSSMDQFDFLTDRGRNLEKRMRDFKIIQPDNLASTYNLINSLTSLASEFKDTLKESKSNAEEPINRPYSEAHILEKNYLQIRLDQDKRALDKSEVYCLWQDRNNYFYENDAAHQLKVEMDSFKCGTKNQAEIRQSYVAMESFQNRFQQNRSGIISFQEYEKRKNAQEAIEAEQERRRLEELRTGWRIGWGSLFIVIGFGIIFFYAVIHAAILKMILIPLGLGLIFSGFGKILNAYYGKNRQNVGGTP